MTLQGAPNNKLAKGDRDENPRGIGLLALIREDLRTHDDNLLSPGFWALCVHRLGNARMGVKTAPLRAQEFLARNSSTASQGGAP